MLALGSYRTAWTWLYKLHRAIVRPDPERFSGVFEVDVPFFGGEKLGKRGHGAVSKTPLGITAEDKGKEGIGPIRPVILRGASSDTLMISVKEMVVVVVQFKPMSGLSNTDWILPLTTSFGQDT
jgi:hypothetical protein